MSRVVIIVRTYATIVSILVATTVLIHGQDEPPQPERQVIYAPVAGIQGFRNWELNMVSHSATMLRVGITIYSADGQLLASKEQSIGSGETRRLDIAKLVQHKSQHEIVGGVAIDYTGTPMAIAAQVTLRDFHGFGVLDDTLEDDMEFKSSTFDAVWWETKHAQSYVLVGNSSADRVRVTIHPNGGLKETLDLDPHATLIRPTTGREIAARGGKIESLGVTSDAAPGAVRVVGFSASRPDKFLQTIRFLDSKQGTEAALYANGLHFANSATHLVVKNLTEREISLSGLLYPAGAASPTRPVHIKPQRLEAGAIQELTLPERTSQFKNAGLKLESSGGIGSAVAGFTSFDATEHIVRTIPFKDIGDMSISTGGYPWRLDGDFDTTIFITNVGKVRAALGAEITPTAAKSYLINTRYLDVGETVIFDLRQLRDSQVSDLHGVRLPKTAASGQFEWSTLFGDGSQRLIGRAEVTSRSSRSASSFSCTACNCPYSTNSASINPLNPSVIAGNTLSIQVVTHQTNVCGSKPPKDVTVIPNSWTINMPGFFSLSTGTDPSIMTGLAGGSSFFSTPVQGITYSFQAGMCKIVGHPQLNPGTTGTSRQPTSLGGPTPTKKTLNGGALLDCFGQPEDPPFPVFYGYQVCEAYTVLDQQTPPQQIVKDGIDFDEDLHVVDTNVGQTSHSASGATDSTGILRDDLAFGSTTHAPAPGSFTVVKQTITLHSTGATVRVNCVDFEATDVSVRDITSTPGATCTRN